MTFFEFFGVAIVSELLLAVHSGVCLVLVWRVECGVESGVECGAVAEAAVCVGGGVSSGLCREVSWCLCWRVGCEE